MMQQCIHEQATYICDDYIILLTLETLSYKLIIFIINYIVIYIILLKKEKKNKINNGEFTK